MARSIKLDNNDYVDASGVWDSTLGMSQESVNGRIITYGKTTVTGNNITANTQYDFVIRDSRILLTDILVASVIMLGFPASNTWVRSYISSNGEAHCVFLTSQTLTSSHTVGFNYLILRP